MKASKTFLYLLAFALFILISFLVDFKAGESIGYNFLLFFKNMGLLLPPVFILIGLFEIWVKKETIEKHLGNDSGIKSYLFILLLSATMIGGLVVALPVAFSLLNKGAKHSVIYTFLFSSAICRIPMTFFEASFLGLKFTLIRLLVSLPLVLVVSVAMGKLLRIPTKNHL